MKKTPLAGAGHPYPLPPLSQLPVGGHRTRAQTFADYTLGHGLATSSMSCQQPRSLRCTASGTRIRTIRRWLVSLNRQALDRRFSFVRLTSTASGFPPRFPKSLCWRACNVALRRRVPAGQLGNSLLRASVPGPSRQTVYGPVSCSWGGHRPSWPSWAIWGSGERLSIGYHPSVSCPEPSPLPYSSWLHCY